MSTLAEALRLAALGLRLVRLHHPQPDGSCSCPDPVCRKPGKHPSIGGKWGEKATFDPAVLTRWFAQRPDDNLGVTTGRGLVVVDVDGETGAASLAQLQAAHRPLPPTARARTGSGGCHLYFRVPTGVAVPNSAGTLAPGIDIRGDGGQVVAPPSRHHSGNSYAWDRPPEAGIADCPAWLLKLIAAAARPPKPRRGPSVCRRSSERPRVGPESHPTADALGSTKEAAGEAYALLVRETIGRFAIAGPNTRYRQTVRLVGSLVGRGYGEATILGVTADWLQHNLGHYEAELEAALAQAESCLYRTLGNIDFQLASPPSPSQLLPLTPIQEQFLNSHISSGMIVLPTLHTSTLYMCESGEWRVESGKVESGNWDQEKGRKLCGGKQERAFVEALLAHVIHKLLNTDDTVIRATDNQIMEIMEVRSGVIIDRRDYYTLKGKYVTRLDRPAAKCELMVELVKGERLPGQRVGVPSAYALGAIGWLLELELDQGEQGPFDDGAEFVAEEDGREPVSFDAEDFGTGPVATEAGWWLDAPGSTTEAQEDLNRWRAFGERCRSVAGAALARRGRPTPPRDPPRAAGPLVTRPAGAPVRQS